jgi:hypothetical protein
MPWNDLANNQTISFANLKDAVDTGVFVQKIAIPISNKQIMKSDADSYVWINTSFPSYASKANFQLVVKSNLECFVPFVDTPNLRWSGIANDADDWNPLQLISGNTNLGGGRIYRSTNFGSTYFEVLVISDGLRGIKYAPQFRHASYLTVTPFVAVGNNGRIVTNSVQAATSWITISSPTTQDLTDSAFNLNGKGVIVGENRILRTSTDNRINSWVIVNSVSGSWQSVATDNFNFVAVGLDNKIITAGALATTWTVRNSPALSPLADFRGVTYHTDGYFYAVGNPISPSDFNWFMMRSSDSGVNWESYAPINFELFSGRLSSIASINGRLVIGGINYQYQIKDNVLSRCASGVGIEWRAIVKNANSNGFDMAGFPTASTTGAYSNFD